MIGQKLFGIGIKIGGSLDGSLGQSIRAAERNLKGLAKTSAKGFSEAAAAGRKSFSTMISGPVFQGAAVAATGLGLAIGASVKAAVDFESAMADVVKVVPGLESPPALAAMRKDILDLSRRLPVTAEGLAAITAAAGQAGIEKSGLTRFAEDAAKMAIAFDMTAAEAGDAMAKLRTSLSLGQDEVVGLADAMNHLSNNMASTAPQITNFMLRVGAFGKQVKLSEQQVAAFGSAMIAAGAEPEVAATSFRNLIKAMTKMDSASERTAGAFATVMGTGNVANLKQQLKDLAGQGGKGVAKLRKTLKTQISRAGDDVMISLGESMQKDGAGTIQMVLQSLAKMPAAQRISLASDMFGDEARGLTPLLKNTKALAAALDLVADPNKYKGSMLKEFEARSKTTANQMILLQNNVTGLAIAVGDKLLPIINKAFEAATPTIRWLADMAERFPLVTTTVLGVTTAFVGLVALAPFIASFLSVAASLGATLGALQLGATLAGSLGAVVPILAGLGALLTAPITLVVLAIAGIGLAFVAAYKHVDWFRARVDRWMVGFRQAWGGLTEFLGGAWGLLVGALTLDGERFAEGWASIVKGLGQMWEGWVLSIAALFGTSIDTVKAVFDIFVGVFTLDLAKLSSGWERATKGFGEAFDRAMKAIGRAFANLGATLQAEATRQFDKLGKTAGEKFVNALKMAIKTGTPIGWLSSLVGAIDGATRPRPTPQPSGSTTPTGQPETPSTLPLRRSPADYPSPRRALGGQVFKGVEYLVGEHRAEVFRAPMSGRIFPSAEAADRAETIISQSGLPGLPGLPGQPGERGMPGRPMAPQLDDSASGRQGNPSLGGRMIQAISTLGERLLPRQVAATVSQPALPRITGKRSPLGSNPSPAGDRLAAAASPPTTGADASRRVFPSMEAANRIIPAGALTGRGPGSTGAPIAERGIAAIGRQSLPAPLATTMPLIPATGQTTATVPPPAPATRVAPHGKQGLSGPLLAMQPGAIQVTVGNGDPGTVERAVAAALEQFRYELESSYRSMLSD